MDTNEQKNKKMVRWKVVAFVEIVQCSCIALLIMITLIECLVYPTTCFVRNSNPIILLGAGAPVLLLPISIVYLLRFELFRYD